MDLIEQHFWLDPVEGVEYALPFMLAAAIYCREANRDVAVIGKFFEKGIPQPYHRQWQCAARSLIRSTSFNPSHEELSSLEELARIIHQRCPQFSSVLSSNDFQIEITAALYWRLGEAYFQKNSNEALKWYEKALNQLENEDEIREATALASSAVAMKLLDENKFKEAKFILDRAIELNTTNSFLYSSRGTIFINLKECQKAIADFDRVIELKPPKRTYGYSLNLKGDTYFNRGIAYFYLKEYRQAVADYSSAISDYDRLDGDEAKSKKADTYLKRGQAYTNLQEYQQSIVDYNNAIKYSSENEHEGYKLKGLALYALQRFQEAVDAFHKSSMAGAGCFECLHSLARAYKSLYSGVNIERVKDGSDYQSVIDYYNHIIQLNPTNLIAIVNRGVAYHLMGNDQEALANLNRTLELDPNNINAFLCRSEIFSSIGQHQKALADLDKYIAFGKNRLDHVRHNRALLLSYLGRFDEAVEEYQQLLKDEPEEISFLYNIALYFYGLGGLEALTNDTDQALNHLQEAISADNSVDNEVTYWARYDGAWRDLRMDSRFQAIINS